MFSPMGSRTRRVSKPLMVVPSVRGLTAFRPDSGEQKIHDEARREWCCESIRQAMFDDT